MLVFDAAGGFADGEETPLAPTWRLSICLSVAVKLPSVGFEVCAGGGTGLVTPLGRLPGIDAECWSASLDGADWTD